MKKTIEKIIKESFLSDLGISTDNLKRAYIRAINEKRDGLLVNALDKKNFEFILGNEITKNKCGEPNKCETNVYSFIKDKLEQGIGHYYPVGGYFFQGQSFFPIEHWWVYDKKMDMHIEISPINLKDMRCYAGFVNMDINKDILRSEKVWDVDFFKGGHVYDNYFR